MTDEFLSELKSLKTFVILFGSLFVFVFVLNIIQPIFHVLLILFYGVIVSVLLSGLGFLVQSRINVTYRSAVTIAILSLLVLSLVGGWFLGREVVKDFSKMIKKLPEAEQTLQEELKKHEWGKSLLHLSSERKKLFSLRGGMLKKLTGLFSETLGQAISLAIILVIGIYMALTPTLYLRGAVKLFPLEKRKKVRDTLSTIGRALRLWLVGRFITMVGVGLLTGIGFFIAGMPNTLSLALLAGLLAFVPFLGPIAAAIPAVLVAVLHNVYLLIPVGIIFVVVHLVEGYIVTPLIQQRTVDLPPVVLIMAQILVGLFLGISGVIIATPLTITVIVIIQKVYIEGFLGDSVKVLGEKG